MRAAGLICILFFTFTSFVKKTAEVENYTLSFEAKGCHYQINLNNELLTEGKSYQKVEKQINIADKLSAEAEQNISVSMYRISREIPLKTTQGYLKVKLEKSIGDSVVMVKEINLPTFPYDDDEIQPQSIAGSILFEKTTNP